MARNGGFGNLDPAAKAERERVLDLVSAASDAYEPGCFIWDELFDAIWEGWPKEKLEERLKEQQ